MRNLIIGLVVFLAACNGSTSNPSTDPKIAELQGELKGLNEALAAATHAQALQAKGVSKLQVVGQVSGFRGEDTLSIAPDFGPCTDMGILIGTTNADSSPADTLIANFQAWRQCTGYVYETAVLDGSIKVGPRVFWDGPNCTGTMYEWEASGHSFNTQALKNGVVFKSPADNSTLMVEAGQTAQPIFMQSVMTSDDPECQADVETQLMYIVTQNDFHKSGVPDDGVGIYSLGSLISSNTL